MYSVYEAPKATRKQWVKFLQRTRVFNDVQMQNVHICSGHFLKTDFNQSQIIPFALGHRKASPLLDQGSIPSQKIAVPFSTVFDLAKVKEQFTKSPIKIETLDLPTHKLKKLEAENSPVTKTSATSTTMMTITLTPIISTCRSTTTTTKSSSAAACIVTPRQTYGYAACYTPSATPSIVTTVKDRGIRLASLSRRKVSKN